MKIENSVALVTGANRGLGFAFAQALLARGARKIYAGVRNPEKIATPGLLPIKLDITNLEDVTAAAKVCGDVTLVVNNAGIFQPVSFLGESAADATRSQLETNFFGMHNMCRAFAPILGTNDGGAIVNVLSVLSWLNLPTAGSYCASKSAAWALTNGIRNELRAQNTLVVAVHAAFIDTDMTKNLQVPKAKPEDIVRRTLEAIEEGREEVLADDTTKKVKRELTAEPPVYVRKWGG